MGLLASGGRAEAEISHRMTIMQCRQLSPPTSLSDALPLPWETDRAQLDMRESIKG